MIRKKLYPAPAEWPALTQRPVQQLAAIEPAIQAIFDQVKAEGDAGVKALTQKFDGVSLTDLWVTDAEIIAAGNLVPTALQTAIQEAAQNIKAFHEQQREPIRKVETVNGVTCWRKSVPIDKVGLYIPGGSAPLFSTLLMLGIPAQLAGCRSIILCTPPAKDGSVHPAILYTAHLLGINRILKVGGAQAIAALAFGTENIPAVHKIFGPGNQYVTVAKQLVGKLGVAIDMPAGPSEVLVMADATANPAFVAADLLSQAEHGPDSQVILLSDSEGLIQKVEVELETQLAVLPRREVAQKALNNSLGVVLADVNQMLAFSDLYAPEHLILAVKNYEQVADKVMNAGSVFLGNYSSESFGDYASGTNHTLPTNGFARAYSGVSLDSFVKKITFQEISAAGLQQLGNTVETMAAAEGLDAHKNAVSIRLKQLESL
ncbi:histidinol dehydrogenase [Adhaeribacter rhizoryzae]|uniref:Histidinol dehydrogenase n=1 Tax=Adhaeribacter rhizoryzae TaxID=2607907 RepID=A0A5M6DMY9_9BACT|nr:histidinol dehydrogenase [Adhaeribacter rhizoryzae]KAA5547746.1 histidinol dehydrogenase [Adhaeribacter rhizoryzae]